ncbi:MAG: helix-turn-helix domain-containing protein, partial [Peptoniphilus harei]|nr:helix-turn-helix domain-containing protein [Peptoniphilus harei]
MKFSDRQTEIIEIVRDEGPITGDEIAEKLGLSRATIRSDLSVLTMINILGARPKFGYFYTG